MTEMKELALGSGKSSEKYGYSSTVSDMTQEERIKTLEYKLKHMTNAFLLIKKQVYKSPAHETNTSLADNTGYNKEGVPINSYFFGMSKGIPYILYVSTDGNYYLHGELQTSLSAAAEKVSGVRRSGWTFWKLADGKTLKEVYKRR